MSKIKMKKLLAVFLAVVITLSTLPLVSVAAAAASVLDGVVVDAPTIKEWKDYLGTAANGSMSTEHSGFIWSDKSVFVDGGAYGTIESYFPGLGEKLALGTNNFGTSNFLVGLATIGSTTEIVGYSVTPTDTMLVLDVSNSMDQSRSIPALISAANDAIESLLDLNRHNRIGVVLFSGNSNFGASATSTGKVILPLGRYQSNEDEEFLSYTGTTDTTVRVASGVKYEGTNNAVPANSKNTIGGTYIQNGLYLAYNQFPSGEDTVIADDKIQAGTQRMPIMVLMTDGAPTTATVNYSNVGTSDSGNGGDTNAAYSFFTQLTASWVNESLKNKYNGTDPKFYTLGLNTVNDTSATGVLNPSSNSNAAKSYWDVFSQNRVITINNVPYATGGSRNVTLRMPTGMTLGRNYVDETWNTSSSNGLVEAFNSIVEEIKIQSRYYGTLVTSNDFDNDGYIYFTDEIGSYMEVKNFKGIHMGKGSLYTGVNFAKDMVGDTYFKNGAVTEEGRILYDALAERLSIDETELQNLLNIAQQNGYISFTDEDNFSNYVAWYADSNNNYLGAYNAQTKDSVPSGAKYLVKSYIFEGEVTASHAKSDMLYALIRVRENLATGRQILDAALPASLLPMVTYNITVNTDSADFTSANITSVTNNSNETHPAVLLYEVGLDSDITPYNIASLDLDNFRKNADGTYSFYSNRWRDDNGDAPTYDVNGLLMADEIHTTGVNYTPSYQNESYYYTNDSVIYKKSSNNYVPVPTTEAMDTANNDYFWLKRIIKKDANGTMSIEESYQPISDETIADTTGNIIGAVGNYRAVLKGTPRKIVRDPAEKADNNPTGTIKYAEIADVDHFGTAGGTDYHVYFFHGNNGKLTVAAAQGIKLTKTVSEEVAGAGNAFEFDVQLSDNRNSSSYPYRHEKADGTVVNGTVTVDATNTITVTLGTGDVFYITDIEEGVSYTVSERYDAYYVGLSANATGIISEYTLNAVDFVNAPRGYGSLLVEKDVTHPFQSLTEEIANKQFEIKVTLTGVGADSATYYDSATAQYVSPVAAAGIANTYEFNFTLTDGQSHIITNIPEGVQYNVEELNIPVGFTLLDGERTGTISRDTTSQALLVNDYKPQSVLPNITLTGTKTILPANYVWDDDDIYYININQVDLATGNTVGDGYTAKLSKNRQGYSVDFATFLTATNGAYTLPGVYTYEIYEYKYNPVEDISYDTSVGLFHVTVADNATGQLYVSDVSAIQNLVTVTGNNANGWTVTKNFTNVYQSYEETFVVEKRIEGAGGNSHLGGIIFGLFESETAVTPIMSAITDAAGRATFTLNTTQSDYATAKTYYIREIEPDLVDRVVGMTYDTETYYTVTVDWSDAAATPTITYKNAAGNDISKENSVITNTYDDNVTSTPAVILSGTKTLINADGTVRDLGGREFEFVAYKSNAMFTAKTEPKLANYNKATGEITFPEFTFDAVGTYYLILEETAGTLGGIEYDKTQYHVAITVEKAEDNNGKTVLVTDSVIIYKVGDTDNIAANKINFTNTYTITDKETVNIEGTKYLTGRNINSGEFKFNLVEVNSEYNTAIFGGITRRTVNGAADAANHRKATFAFDEIEFTAPGTYYFVIHEEIPQDENGVTYSVAAFRVKVEVTDNNNGGLNTPVVTYLDGDIEFTNVYEATPTGIILSGKKTLNNKTLTENAFTFELHRTGTDFVVDTDKYGAPVTDKNDAQGNFGFTLDYEQGDEGHYYYVVKEYIPENRLGVHYDTNEYRIEVVVLDNGLGAMTAYAVVDLFGGESNIALDAIAFTNTYAVNPTETIISGNKTLTGRQLTVGEFEFELYKANDKFEKQGDVISSAKNAADGSFAFGYAIEIVEAGTQYFVVVEKNTRAEHITYDDTVYGVKVIATDNGEGEFTVEKIIEDIGAEQEVTAIEFENVYTPPAPPIVDTGDNANFSLLIALMFISGGAFAGTIFLGKKREEN